MAVSPALLLLIRVFTAEDAQGVGDLSEAVAPDVILAPVRFFIGDAGRLGEAIGVSRALMVTLFNSAASLIVVGKIRV